ncbi:cupin domain-containing protein [Terriglobus tenax]|uniref:cupin domain-containing protein n=1 Tax=Terriglobus tenax TaxID=1111115 RepID=UPI0021DF448A|nr:cupin domain-containing protein [Terriglobus tenax]
MKRTGWAALALWMVIPAMAQEATVDPANVLAARGKEFLEMAKAADSGSYSETLKDYGNHKVMLAARAKTGTPEYHTEWADIFVVLEGEVTMVVGGTLKDQHAIEGKPGELTGSGIEGGTKIVLHKGDVFHLQPKSPHQALLTPGKTLLYYVIKVKQE